MAIKPYEAGSRAGGGLTGMLILNPNSKLKLWRASYGKGTTLIRPWGNTFIDGKNKIQMTPHRDNEGNFGTSFFIQDVVCEGWGKDSRLTFMTRPSDEDNWPNGGPADLFYNEVKGHPDHKWLTEKVSANDFAPLSAPTVNGFLKGLLLECGGKDYKANPIWGCLLRLSKSGKEAFEKLLDMENPKPPVGDSSNDPNQWNSKYLVGDPIGFENGKVFEFDKESKFSSSQTTPEEINLDGRGGDGATAGKKPVFESYDCRMWPSRPNLPMPDAKRVHSANESYEDAIRYLTGQEQIEQIIIPGFGRSCKDAVLYVFGGKDLLPPTFEFGRTTHDMGAVNTAPAAEGQQNTGTVVPLVSTPAAVVTTQPATVLTPAPSLPVINMDGPDGATVDGGEEPPFTPDPTATVEVAEQVVTARAGEPTVTVASATAGDLKSRLAAASNKQA